jgi:hypothetical protein
VPEQAMKFTRYFLVIARPEFIRAVAALDPTEPTVFDEGELWSIGFSYRGIFGGNDNVLCAKLKFGYLLNVIAEYGLAKGEDNAFKAVVRNAIGWPRLNVDSFDRNWSLSFTDNFCGSLEEGIGNVGDILPLVTIELPNELSIPAGECVAEWIDAFSK